MMPVTVGRQRHGVLQPARRGQTEPGAMNEIAGEPHDPLTITLVDDAGPDACLATWPE